MRVSDNSMDRTALLLMDELWQKRESSSKNNIMDDFSSSTLNTSALKAIAAKPDWDCIPSKDVAMSEEEFENAIKDLALKSAEKGMSLGNAGEGRAAFRVEEAELVAKYLSAVAPDRKKSYETYGSSTELMSYSNGVWSAKLTPDELSRSAKFYEIYNNAVKEYEAENGKIPTDSKASTNPYYKDLLAEFKAYNFLNALA